MERLRGPKGAPGANAGSSVIRLSCKPGVEIHLQVILAVSLLAAQPPGCRRPLKRKAWPQMWQRIQLHTSSQ